MCWHIEGTLSSFPPRILVIRFLRAKSLNFTAFNWKHTHTYRDTRTHTHTEGSTGPCLLITSRDCAALIINFYAGPPHTPHLPINPFFVLWILLSLFCRDETEGKTKGERLQVAFLLHGRVELHIKRSWMGEPRGGERVETSACGCTPGGMRADT